MVIRKKDEGSAISASPSTFTPKHGVTDKKPASRRKHWCCKCFCCYAIFCCWVKMQTHLHKRAIIANSHKKSDQTFKGPSRGKNTVRYERLEEAGLPTVDDYDSGSILNSNYTLSNATGLVFNKETFLRNLQRWRGQKEPDAHNVLVIVTYPTLSVNSQPSYDPLITTVRDALMAPESDVVVYLAYHQLDAEHELQQAFGDAVSKGQLQIFGEQSNVNLLRIGASYPHLYNNMNFAFLLDLAYLSGSDYTLFLRAGSKLIETGNVTSPNYALQAVNHYETIVQDRSEHGDYNRTCWTIVSHGSPDLSPPNSIFFETAEHAGRMAILLRSGLPYNKYGSINLLDHYCDKLLYSSGKVLGPPLFTYEKPLDQVYRPEPKPKIAFVNASEFELPPWVDQSVQLGPIYYTQPRSHWITFGVNTMMRPSVGTAYLEDFMTELLQIVNETVFEIPVNKKPLKQNAALIVLVVCGNSLEEIAAHRSFLQTTYADGIERGFIELVDSPLTEYNETLVNRRFTHIFDEPERAYWRTKQNLDIAATITAVAEKSEYVMLLEDDTGFQQPNFTESLSVTLLKGVQQGLGIPMWSRIEYGFGYSGILMHYTDAHVYEQLHKTFADEQPCDWLNIHSIIKSKTNRVVRNRRRFANKKTHFLTHKGKFSTLVGKEQKVW